MNTTGLVSSGDELRRSVGAAPPRTYSAGDDRVSVREFLLFIWRSRWRAMTGGLVCAVLAAVLSLVATPEYTATVTLLPADNRGDSLGLGGVSSAVSQLGGLASLAGLNLGGGGGAKAEALATLQSRAVTYQFVQDGNLLPVLFAKLWNPAAKGWNTTDPRKVPTLWKANERFDKIRTVDDDTKTGLVTLTIKWTDPAQAAAWANGLVKLTNDYLRQRAIDEGERNIAYLNEELTRTNVVEVKSAIYTLMEAEIKKEMIARGRQEFALRVIDPAVTPEQKSFPKRVLWVLAGLIAGVFLGLLASVLRETMLEETHGDSRVAPEAAAPHAR